MGSLTACCCWNLYLYPVKKLLLTFIILASGLLAQEMDAYVVTAKKHSPYEHVGEYQQPAWTLTRKFPSTRVYVMTPPGTSMYEKWFEVRERADGPSLIRMRDEFAVGLGHRLELDLYAHTARIQLGSSLRAC
jgi:hypothetical protein